ncbi:BREX-1 system adenine-specific DNA-methyltransferase PglX [Acetobacterium sp. UBA5834]|uniref:BREX-1 system adenine-specific DNA-methyltransferase PglX n=1 Tax=Acetobacterium sp. UBA5834 TaxID=1945907 RepID=UPI00257B615C|nr:BREX-1 system adenine-specific DNA-methyltransferase PglX [Acetobacterium sp. UBA5834]
MNKTAIKNFAIWARNKLIADISYKAALLGITEKGIKSPLPQSTQTVQFFDIGTKEPSSITGLEIQQRKKLVEEIEKKAKQSDYATAYKNVIEEVAYTWFNRLIAIRFMEVNDYLPTRIRVLSSESNGKAEPDLVTHALEANLDYSAYEKDRIIQLKHENKLDDLFRMLFIKQCNALNANLPELFEKTNDYSELLLNVSFTDKEGVIYHLVDDIDEDDFNVSKEGQVEIIGWLYQYYNTEPKDETFALLKKNVKITKERIPAATQLFTPDWIVRYMVENSLGRLWLEGHMNDEIKSNWKYYLDEAKQEEYVQNQLIKIREEYKAIKPEDIKVIDPAMGSGHILVYTFDVLMQIYESNGYTQRDAAKSIIENNIYGLDIDKRAYQLAYFAVMMKGRQYNRRILNSGIDCHIYAIQDSNAVNKTHLVYFGGGFNQAEKSLALFQINSLIDAFRDAKEYGSIITVENYNWELLRKFIKDIDLEGQLSLESLGIYVTKDLLELLIGLGETLAGKYDVVVTNPPYMGSSGMGEKLSEYVKKFYPDSKSDLFAVFIEKCAAILKPMGYQAMITQHAWMFLSSYEKLRDKLIQRNVVNMAHLGTRAFEEIGGEVVQTTAFVMSGHKTAGFLGTYVRLVDFNSQSEKETVFLSGKLRYTSSTDAFQKVPGRPLAYWANRNLLRSFEIGIPLGKKVTTRVGIMTGDNERFLRLWWQVSIENTTTICKSVDDDSINKYKWFPYNKGGGYRKWYGNNEYLINFNKNGYEIFEHAKKDRRNSQNYPNSLKFRESLTWSVMSSGPISVRYSKEGTLFDIKGSSCFADDEDLLIYCLAFLNSAVSRSLLSFISPTLDYNAGYVGKLPLIYKPNYQSIKMITQQCIELARTDWNNYETSWEFNRHPLIRDEQSLSESFNKWKSEADERFNSLKIYEEKLNRTFIDIYGFQDELSPEVEDIDITVQRSDLSRDIRSLISYAVGCMFGRYSLDVDGLAFAGGKFDESNYCTFVPDKDNILPLTDEEYFEDDIVELFIKFIKEVFGESSIDKNLKFISDALGGKGNNSREVIRNYFVKDFYKDHCKIYQKRPIYWLFDSGKQNGFKALIYMHRYDENTIGNLRIDYLHRMQRIYENEIARMQDTIDNSKDAREVSAATKRKEKLIKQLQETKEYDEKIAHLALARTSIDLDDGVKVNYEKVQTDREGKKLDVLAKI